MAVDRDYKGHEETFIGKEYIRHFILMRFHRLIHTSKQNMFGVFYANYKALSLNGINHPYEKYNPT